MMVRCVVPPHRILLTCGSLLAKRQFERIFGLFADPKPPAEVNVTWSGYQDNVIARRSTDRHEGRKLLDAAIDALSSELPAGLVELKRLGRTLWRRAADALAYCAGTSNPPTESINGRLEHLNGSDRGFRNLTHYIAKCLLKSVGFRPVLHSRLR